MSAATITATFSSSTPAPRHGQVSPSDSSEAMDVDRDVQHPPSGDPAPGIDVMNLAVVSTQPPASEVRIPGLLMGNDVVETMQQPPKPPVLERPRDEDNGTGDDAEAQSQTAPLSPTTSPVHETPLKLNPLFTSNLISLYGLDGLAATVARTDPQTGEKINKMRKSYEGQLKSFALSGKNKSVKHDETKGMGLSEMATWPEEEWQNQKVYGKDVRNGMPEAMKAKLEKAMHMLPGPVPENEKWEDLLGIEKGKPVDANKEKGQKNALVNKANGPQVNGNRALNTTQANSAQVPDPIRARRTTKKRRYDDGSFEGYGEGFVDDDMEIGYSSGESRSTKNSTGQRKRRKTKDYTNSPAEYGGSRNNSFTAGPMGISASYGR